MQLVRLVGSVGASDGYLVDRLFVLARRCGRGSGWLCCGDVVIALTRTRCAKLRPSWRLPLA